MTRRWMSVLMVLLAVAMVGTTGCTRKKKKPLSTNEPYSDLIPIGYNADGTPIYGTAADLAALAARTEGAEVAGQFEAVKFEYDSTQLNPSEQHKINVAVSYLQQNPTAGIVVEGHCDERGSNEYNLSLGERRALAVRAAMIAAGVDGARIQTRSYGEERPVAFGHDEASWQLNRRAEFLSTQM